MYCTRNQAIYSIEVNVYCLVINNPEFSTDSTETTDLFFI